MGRLEERVIIVTGGAHGIGRAYCEGLAREAARVVVADLDTPANHKKAKALPDGATARWADLTDAAAVDRLLTEVSPSVVVHLAAAVEIDQLSPAIEIRALEVAIEKPVVAVAFERE